jgi:long-chain acyl-CoA synthetase
MSRTNNHALRSETTLIQMLESNARTHGGQPAFREKARGIWHQTTWSQLFEKVLHCAAGLQSLGFKAGDALLVLGDNNAHLYVGMLAASTLRGYAMPAYPDANADEIAHFMGDVRIKAVLAHDQEQVDKALDLRAKGAHIDHIVYDEARGMHAYEVQGLMAWPDLICLGAVAMRVDPDLGAKFVADVQPGDPAVLVHSSGTTGPPKAIVLSHRNVLAAMNSAMQGDLMPPGCEFVAYLPMAWIGDFEVTVVGGIMGRCIINIPERQETVLRDLREVAPMFYLATPRSWENMLTSIQVRMVDSTPLKRWIYDFFMGRAVESERLRLAGKASTAGEWLWRRLGEWMVYGPIKDHFGLSRVTHAWTGGEAIGEDTFVFYRALGVRLRQLYGQTELSAFAAVQLADEVQLHTVGRPLPGVDIRISGDGEVLVRSAGVFAGYLNRPEADAAALEDGWLHTGDAGYLEEDGHLVILGRVAEVVYTAGGDRFVPNYIENRLKFSAYVKDAAVLGAGRKYLAAMICIDFGAVGHWAEVNGVAYMSYADLSQHPQVQALLRETVARVNHALPEPLRIRRFVSLHKEFDPDDGEITRTRKLRRNIVEQLYAAVICSLYDGSETVALQARVTYENGDSGFIERTLALKEI